MYMLVNLGTQEHKFNTKLDLYIYIYIFFTNKILLSCNEFAFIITTLKVHRKYSETLIA